MLIYFDTGQESDPRLRSPPRKDKRRADLVSDALPFGRLWFSDQLHNTIKSRTMGNRTIVLLSLSPLLNPVESERLSHLRLRRLDRRAEGHKAS